MPNDNISEDLAKLRELNAYSLPNNPAEARWDTGKVKRKFYQGEEFLLRKIYEVAGTGLSFSFTPSEDNPSILIMTVYKNGEVIDTQSINFSGIPARQQIYDDNTVGTVEHQTNDIWFDETE